MSWEEDNGRSMSWEEEGVLSWKGRGSVLRRSVSWEEDNGRIVSGFFLWFWFYFYFLLLLFF